MLTLQPKFLSPILLDFHLHFQTTAAGQSGTEAKIPFSLPGCQTCACNFSAVVAFSEDLETSRALCNQKFFFLIQWLPCNANGHFC